MPIYLNAHKFWRRLHNLRIHTITYCWLILKTSQWIKQKWTCPSAFAAKWCTLTIIWDFNYNQSQLPSEEDRKVIAEVIESMEPGPQEGMILHKPRVCFFRLQSRLSGPKEHQWHQDELQGAKRYRSARLQGQLYGTEGLFGSFC